MYPYLRWLGVVFRRRPRPGPAFLLEPSRLTFHVWPGDLDFFGHMNNGRYLALMDSGRFDILARLGFLPVMRKRRWISVLGAATIQFRRPLAPFQRFELVSRLLGWDDKWFFIEQSFESNEKLYARALVRGLFREKGRSVPPGEALHAAGVERASAPLPDEVLAWSRLQDSPPSQPV